MSAACPTCGVEMNYCPFQGKHPQPTNGDDNCPRCAQPRFVCICTPEELDNLHETPAWETPNHEEIPVNASRTAPVRVFNKTTGQDDRFESWEAYLEATKEQRTARQQQFYALGRFSHLFAGNPNAYALFDGKRYETIQRSDDWPRAWERHLRGEYPSLLSIPILPNGNCYFAALDIDRHEGCSLPPLDHVALAKRVTELNFPLVIWQSKNGKGGYAGIFFKDQQGCDAAIARRVLAHYRNLLQLQGAEEIFPKQTGADDQRAGNGFNLPYFGSVRIAFGRDGEELTIQQFLALAEERRVWGALLAREFPADSTSTKEEEYGPLPVTVIQRLCSEKLAELPLLQEGDRHDGLVRVTYFIAMAFAAKALTESEAELKKKIWEGYVEGWKRSGKYRKPGCRQPEDDTKSAAETWDAGLKKPLQILDPEKEAAEALAYVDTALSSDDPLDVTGKKELIRRAARLTRLDLVARKKQLRQRLEISDKDLDGALAEQHAKERPKPEVPNYQTIAQVLAEFGKQGEEGGRFFVVHNYGDKCVVASLEPDPHPAMQKRIALNIQSFENFQKRFDNIRVLLGHDRMGNPITEGKGSAWLDHSERRQFERIVYAPGETLGPNIKNLWQGFAVEPNQGDCSLFLNFVRDVICGGNNEHFKFLTGWMAYAVQHPSEQGYACPVLRGLEGIGKNFFADSFGFLWRKHYLPLTHAEHVGGRFNHHLWDCSVLFANEAFFAGDYQREAMMKTYITDSTLTIEQKFVNIITVPNLLHVIIASNSPWVVRAAPDARRFFVLDVADSHRNDTAYFGKIKRQLEAGGYEALLHHLLNMELADFNPRLVPRTDALREQMALSLTGVEAAWFECLLSGRIPGRWLDGKKIELRASEFIAWAKNHDRRWQITDKALRDLLGRNAKLLRQPMEFEDKRHANGGKRYRVIPPLDEARAKWNQVRFAWDWPPTIEDKPDGQMTATNEWEPFELGREPV